MDEQKKQALKAALAQIDKQFGKGSVMYLGDDQAQAASLAVGHDGLGGRGGHYLQQPIDRRAADRRLPSTSGLAPAGAHRHAPL